MPACIGLFRRATGLRHNGEVTSTTPAPRTARARVRAELTAEIKDGLISFFAAFNGDLIRINDRMYGLF